MKLKIKKLYPDTITPTKANATDSGWDLYAHTFKEVYSGVPMEHKSEIDPDAGYIPGVQQAPDELILNPMERVTISCGFACAIDGVSNKDGAASVMVDQEGTQFTVELQVRPRSGNRRKEGLEVHLGTVDAGYRGEISIVLTNLGNQARTIRKGDRVAQLVPVLIALPSLAIVEDLDTTSRGDTGFGDSGKRAHAPLGLAGTNGGSDGKHIATSPSSPASYLDI